MKRRRPYQFTLRRLLFLSTAIAIALTFASGIRGPQFFRIGLGLYLAGLITWLVMRWSVVRENWIVVRRERLAEIQRRRELAIKVAKQIPLASPPTPVNATQPLDGDSR
jgi:hypothetical protein